MSKFREGIAAPFAVIFSLLVLVATGTVGFMVYRGAEDSLIDASNDRLKHTAEVIEVRLAASVEAIAKDLRFLVATPPVQGMMRAHVSGIRSDRTFIDPETYIDDREWLDQLANTLSVFLDNRPSYFRVSFLGLTRDIRELVRVEKRSHEVFRVPNDRLESKGEEGFYRTAVRLESGAFYLSDITLEPRPNGSSAVPLVRAITPVYASNGQVYGFIAIHVDARYMFKAFESLIDPSLTLYLANSSRRLLIGPGKARNFAARFPAAASWLRDGVSPALVEELDSGEEPPQIAYFERVAFSTEPNPHHLVVGITSPYESILGRVSRVRSRSLLITLLFGLVGIALALGLSGYLTHPIRQITRALSRFGHDGEVTGAPVPLPTTRQDEIGALARTFDAMTGQIQRQMQELEEKEHRQRIILETSVEGIIVVTEDGQIETFNQAAEQLLGYPADEAVGTPIEQMLVDRAAGSEASAWKQVGSGQDVQGRRSDGSTVPLSLAVSAFAFAGEQKCALFFEDISERKRYEQALQDAKERAEEIARLKSAFLANMSHEIRTPLTTVIGYASVLSREALEKHRRFAKLIKSNGKRLMDTLNSVLLLARLEASGEEMDLDLLNVAEEAEEITTLFQPLAEKKNLTLTFEALSAPEDTHAFLNRGGFSSILQNLVGNAIKFTEDGTVAVRVGSTAAAVQVHVEDTGIGIGAEFAPQLFDKFVQESTGVSRSHEGTGLGLAITKRLAESMNGAISVKSEKGVGTVFTVSFPRATVSDKNQDNEIAPAAFNVPSMLNGMPAMRILLVEDNPDTASMVCDLLHETPCMVTHAADADEALCAAQDQTFDLVLLDINLGGGPSGVDVLHQLRGRSAHGATPIAALTAYSLPGDRSQFLEMGFDAYLSKPFAPNDLYQLIASLLEPAG